MSKFSKWIKRLINRLRNFNHGHGQKTTVVEKKTEHVSTALELAKIELHNKRKRAWEGKAIHLANHYEAALNGFLNEYFNTYSDDETENAETLEVLDKAYVKYASDANASQNKIKLDGTAFRENVKRIVSSPNFQEQLKIAKEKNLKTEENVETSII